MSTTSTYETASVCCMRRSSGSYEDIVLDINFGPWRRCRVTMTLEQFAQAITARVVTGLNVELSTPSKETAKEESEWKRKEAARLAAIEAEEKAEKEAKS